MNQKVKIPAGATALSSDLLNRVKAFNRDELSWLSGYCQGLCDGRADGLSKDELATKKQLAGSNDKTKLSIDGIADPEQSENKPNPIILYASQTGNAQKIAESLNASFSNKGIDAEISSVGEFNPKNLKRHSHIFLVTSTHGEGEPPDDAIEFLEFIQGKRAPEMPNSQFAILALGDSSYQYFCQTGKDFEQAFNRLGAKSIIDRVDCDLDFELSAKQWVNLLFEKIEVSITTAQSAGSIELHSAITELDGLELATVDPVYSRSNPFTGAIIQNQRITANDSNKTVHHIEISLQDSALSYQPGDSLGILAKNNQSLVNKILAASQLFGDEKIEFKGKIKTIQQALVEDLEITLVNPNLIKNYSELVALESGEKATLLKEIAENEFKEWVKNHQLLDLLLFAKVPLKPQQLVDLLKPVKPRIYSIASSLQANPEEAHLTVSLKQSSNENAMRYGSASQYLVETLAEDEPVQLFIESNHRFKLPNDSSPIIMIGPGTGIAPFRAFLQQRELSFPKSDNWLFFGNPNFNSDFLYQLEIQKYLKQGLLTRLDLAFSRDQAEKVYVQDRLLQNAAEVWRWLNEENAYLYVCGDVNHMAKDVNQTLLEIISLKGNLSSEEANSYLKKLKKENRYQRDVY